MNGDAPNSRGSNAAGNLMGSGGKESFVGGFGGVAGVRTGGSSFDAVILGSRAFFAICSSPIFRPRSRDKSSGVHLKLNGVSI